MFTKNYKVRTINRGNDKTGHEMKTAEKKPKISKVAEVVAELKKLGIEVKNGKVKKSDIRAAFKCFADAGQVDEIKLHDTFQPGTYYVEFNRLPVKAKKILYDAKPEIENSRYTVFRNYGYIRAKVEVNNMLWDAEIGLGSVDLEDSDYQYIDRQYVTEDGEPVDSDAYAEETLDQLWKTIEIQHLDVYLSNPRDV